MYEITSRENRFCNAAAWGLFSLSVYIKVYTYKKCYKEVINGPAERCKLALTQRSQILPICNFLIKSSQEAKIYTPYYI